MALLFDASAGANYPRAALPDTPMLNVYPLSIFCWTYQPDASSFSPWAVQDVANHGLDAYFDAGNYVGEAGDGTNSNQANVTQTAYTGKWACWGVSYRASNNLNLFTPGYGFANGIVGNASLPVNLTKVGFANYGGTTQHAMAEFAAWRGEMADGEFRALLRGVNPRTIQPGKMLFYFPLRGDVRDYGPLSLPVSGIGTWDKRTARFTAHPDVALPPRPRRIIKPGVVVVPPAGTPRPRITMVA